MIDWGNCWGSNPSYDLRCNPFTVVFGVHPLVTKANARLPRGGDSIGSPLLWGAIGAYPRTLKIISRVFFPHVGYDSLCSGIYGSECE